MMPTPVCFHIPLPKENQRSLIVMRFILHHMMYCKKKCQCKTLMDFAIREKLTQPNMREVVESYDNKVKQLSK